MDVFADLWKHAEMTQEMVIMKACLQNPLLDVKYTKRAGSNKENLWKNSF